MSESPVSKRIYVASSWRNEFQQAVVADLRRAGHEVYDFKNPHEGNNGFGWREIDPDWEKWTARRYIEGLSHPVAQAGFHSDLSGMQWANCCVLVLPCGRSAHLELGWFMGQGKETHVLIPPVQQLEPELMYLLGGSPSILHTDIEDLLAAVGKRWDPEGGVKSKTWAEVADRMHQLRAKYLPAENGAETIRFGLQMLYASSGVDTHPLGWEFPCNCNTCRRHGVNS